MRAILMRWMNLQPIIQSEVSQKEKDKYQQWQPTPVLLPGKSHGWGAGRLQSMRSLRVVHN